MLVALCSWRHCSAGVEDLWSAQTVPDPAGCGCCCPVVVREQHVREQHVREQHVSAVIFLV